MYVLYLVQWSSDAQNLESQSQRLVKDSDQGDEQSGYGGGCSNDCHILDFGTIDSNANRGLLSKFEVKMNYLRYL